MSVFAGEHLSHSISFGTASDLTGRRTVMAAVVLVASSSIASAVEPTTRTSTGIVQDNVMIRTPSGSQDVRQTAFSKLPVL